MARSIAATCVSKIFRSHGVPVIRDAIFRYDDWQLFALQPSQGPVEALG